MTDLAPIALFVHARPEHSEKTLEALSANILARNSRLVVFSDGPRNDAEAAKVAQVRQLLKRDWGFAEFTVIVRDNNLGLADSIRAGVTELAERYGRVIVVEDDLVTSPHFLTFMNAALDRYRDEPAVWHINGWAYPLTALGHDRAYFIPIMNCWGWATWADRWAHLNSDPQAYLSHWKEEDIRRFNIEGGADNWSDLKRNAAGLMKTWAVFWYATIFARRGLCVAPPVSFVRNIGVDGSGVNSGSFDRFAGAVLATDLPRGWPDQPEIDKDAYRQIVDFLQDRRPPLWRRLGSKVKWRIKAIAATLK